METIMYYKRAIRQCEMDIEYGRDVDGNKETILELQDAIWEFKRRIQFKLSYL
jgi:hypothetical protein